MLTRRLIVVAATAVAVGGAVGFALATVLEESDPIVLLTFALVAVTVYYAVQTRNMATEMRADRIDAQRRDDRVRQQPVLLELLSQVDVLLRATNEPFLSHFATYVDQHGLLVGDGALGARLDIAAVACRTLASDNTLKNEGDSKFFVQVLLRELRPSLAAALRGEPCPDLRRPWPERAAVQAAVIDASRTLERWK